GDGGAADEDASHDTGAGDPATDERSRVLWSRAPTASGPMYRAASPSSSSIRSKRLYFATRSLRDGAPVLIWPVPIATTRSAIVVSSVSPERCDTTAVQPARRARVIASIVSVSVPIWFSLIRTLFAASSAIALWIRSVLVT